MEFDLLRFFPIFELFYPFKKTLDMAIYLVLSAFTKNKLSLLANTKAFVFFLIVVMLLSRILTSSA